MQLSYCHIKLFANLETVVQRHKIQRCSASEEVEGRKSRSKNRNGVRRIMEGQARSVAAEVLSLRTKYTLLDVYRLCYGRKLRR